MLIFNTNIMLLLTISNSKCIGLIAGVFTALSLLPQLIKIMKEKKSNISIYMLLVLITGLGLWIYYGCLIKDFPVIVTNSFSLFINLLVLNFTIKYKKRK